MSILAKGIWWCKENALAQATDEPVILAKGIWWCKENGVD